MSQAPSMRTPRGGASAARPAPLVSSTLRAGVEAGELHVWWFRPLPGPAERVGAVAGRHHTETARTVRSILSHYLGRLLHQDEIDRTCEHCAHPGHGRPRLRGKGLSFNLTHLEGRAIIAVARDSVGIDAELVSAGRTVLEAAEMVLSEDERQSLPGRGALNVRSAAWAWCAKEAVTKATGFGLATDPRTVHPPLHIPPEGRWEPVRPPEGRELWVSSVLLPGPCICAVAIDGPRPQQVKARQWPGNLPDMPPSGEESYAET